MRFETALNVVWLVMGMAMLALAVYDLTRRPLRRSASWLRIAVVLAIAGTLFPYVSATDDLVWMDANASRSEHQGSRSDSNSSRVLLNLYQAADTSLVASAVRIGCVFVVIALISAPLFRSGDYRRGHVMGRSPPPALAC